MCVCACACICVCVYVSVCACMKFDCITCTLKCVNHGLSFINPKAIV